MARRSLSVALLGLGLLLGAEVSAALAQDLPSSALDSLGRVRVRLFGGENMTGRFLPVPTVEILTFRRSDEPWRSVSERTMRLNWPDIAAIDAEKGRATLIGAVIGNTIPTWRTVYRAPPR